MFVASVMVATVVMAAVNVVILSLISTNVLHASFPTPTIAPTPMTSSAVPTRSPTLAPITPFVQSGRVFGAGGGSGARQGTGVALSANGSLLVVGAPAEDGLGALWTFFTLPNGEWAQAGEKQRPSGLSSGDYFGRAVSLSADGSRVASGANQHGSSGAAWVFSRNATAWEVEAGPLVGSDADGDAGQGVAVALSADGSTLAVGGDADNSSMGAAWVYARSPNGTWTQQGPKLVGTGSVGSFVRQGISVALSSDGNILAVGADSDDSDTGAVWVFERVTNSSGATWAQVGTKLVGAGSAGGPSAVSQGFAVSISADGNTLVSGAYRRSGYDGGAWIFARSTQTGAYQQQGGMLYGTGVDGASQQGISVAMAASGEWAAVGGNSDAGYTGAVWVFYRVGAEWVQYGPKLVGAMLNGSAALGTSVAVAEDTIAAGGNEDGSNHGATWIFRR